MIQVTIDSIRVSLTKTQRAILLKELNDDRQLAIFIHPNEADAILAELQGFPHPRPLTHDLLKNCIAELGGELQYVVVNELRDGIFFALLHIRQGGMELDIDARPSDSIALAVRAKVPIFVQEVLMEQEGIYPASEQEIDESQLSVFKDFVESLDIDDLETG
jgi:bifunctional DNase/RNase